MTDTDIRYSEKRDDPSLLTTAQLLRVNAELKELIFTRLDAMDKAMVLFNENMTRVPTDTDKQIRHLRELLFERFETQNEKFASVQKQFMDRDVRVDQAAKDAKISLDAALSSAEKAVAKQNESFALSIQKSETATNKQIDTQSQLLQSLTAALNDKIDDLKGRMTRQEGAEIGSHASTTQRQAAGNSQANWGGLIVGIILAVVAIASFMISRFGK